MRIDLFLRYVKYTSRRGSTLVPLLAHSQIDKNNDKSNENNNEQNNEKNNDNQQDEMDVLMAGAVCLQEVVSKYKSEESVHRVYGKHCS